jgi:predicted nucleotidyltransferase
MGEQDRNIVMELKQRLPVEVKSHLAKLILYGSRARGDAADDSDLDLIALVDEKTPEIENQLEDIAYRLMWDHNFQPIISLKVFSEERFRQATAKGLSFYRNVEREGVEL